MPSDRELMRYILRCWKENSVDGRVQFHLLFLLGINQVAFPARFSADAFSAILAELNRPEMFYRIYAEGKLHGVPDTPEYGCLVLGHRRPNNEPGYYAVVFDDEHFLEGYSYISIVPDGTQRPGRLEILTAKGWQNVNAEEATNFPEVRIVLATLKEHINRIDPESVARRNITVDPATDPPTDEELMRRLLAAHKQKARVTTGTIPLSAIIPFSLEFCAKIAPAVSAERISQGYRPALLVYWNGTGFVMSDDYFNFLGYRKLNIESVPVAILGDFPSEIVSVSAIGGTELLPPVGIGTGVIEPPRSSKLEQWLLDQKLRRASKRTIPADLAATWLGLADLLADDETSEADVHNYLVGAPPIVAPSGKAIDSEVRLGAKYKIDIVFRTAGVTEDVFLVELENPDHTIFTRDGRPRKEVAHAKQQVEDWLRWVQENPNDAFVQTLGGLPPRGLAVIGKSRQLNDDERKRLAHLNLNSKVQVITYDELLDRFGDLILQQCDDHRD